MLLGGVPGKVDGTLGELGIAALGVGALLGLVLEGFDRLGGGAVVMPLLGGGDFAGTLLVDVLLGDDMESAIAAAADRLLGVEEVGRVVGGVGGAFVEEDAFLGHLADVVPLTLLEACWGFVRVGR